MEIFGGAPNIISLKAMIPKSLALEIKENIHKYSLKKDEPKSQDVSKYKKQFFKYIYEKKVYEYIQDVINSSDLDNSQIDKSKLLDNIISYGIKIRFDSISYFEKVTLKINITDTICTALKIRDIETKKETIYGFIYSTITNTTDSVLTDAYSTYTGNIRPVYFCTGGSSMSKDGEYRLGLISIHNIALLVHPENKDSEISELWNQIEFYLSKKLFERNRILFNEHYYPTDDVKITHSLVEIVSNTYARVLFAVAWFNDIMNVMHNTLESHLNENYSNIMLSHIKEDLQFIKKLLKGVDSRIIQKLRSVGKNILGHGVISPSIPFAQYDTSLKIGQKIIPLNLSEVQYPFNIRYKPWKEYMISTASSSLVLNCICPSFFITNRWMFIKNTKQGIFDNEVQYTKMEKSEIAKSMLSLMIRSQLYTYENIKSKKLKKQFSRTISSWLSEKFQILHDKIQDPIDYINSNLIMSDVALCIFSEYVGRTFMDSMFLNKKSEYYADLIGTPFTKKGFPYFKKYLFELCYALYCLNTKLGVIHGDLHLHNITLHPFNYRAFIDIRNLKTPHILYILDKKTQFVMPHCGYTMCIIDFSRSVVLPSMLSNLKNSEVSDYFPIVDDMNKFQSEQITQLIAIYTFYFPEHEYNKEELKIIFNKKYDAVFKLMTVVDLYGVTQKLDMVFNMGLSDLDKPTKKHKDLVTRLNNLCENYLTSELNKLITIPEYEARVLEDNFPLYDIIKKVFYENLIEQMDLTEVNIMDVFDHTREIKYNLNTYKEMPNFMNDYSHKSIKKNIIDKILSDKYENRRLTKIKQFDILKLISRRHREKNLYINPDNSNKLF
jgi:hypothetical protein